MAVKIAMFSFDGDLTDRVTGGEAHSAGEINYVSGVNGQALKLNGEDSYLIFTSDMLRQWGSQYTISFWQYGTGLADREGVVLEAYRDSETVLRITVPDEEGIITLWYHEQQIQRRPEPCFYLNSWNYWSFVFDAESGVIMICRNGMIVSQNHTELDYLSGIDEIRIGADKDGARLYSGYLDDLIIYGEALSLELIREEMNGLRAVNPSPADAAHLLRKDDIIQPLKWQINLEYQAFDVYIGTAYNTVFLADHESPEYQGMTTDQTFNIPEGLDENIPYYWRIDVVTDNAVIKGLPWKMTIKAFDGNVFAAWGQETNNTIERDFRIRGYNGYYEDNASNAWSFMWPNSIWLMAISSAAKINRNRYFNVLNNYILQLNDYLTYHNGIYGYDSSANPGLSNRFYDDNSWMAVALCDAYEITENVEHLEKALTAYNFTLSGETAETGGGILWKETTYEGDPELQKAISSTAGAAHAAAKLYAITGEERYLKDGERLLNWIFDTLLDTDSTVLNSIYLTGEIDYTKWSYNTGVPALACLKIYQQTGEEDYLERSIKLAKASVQFWMELDKGTLIDNSCFAFTLSDLYMGLYKQTQNLYWEGISSACLHYVHSTRDIFGRYPYFWNDNREEEYESWGFLYTAPNAHAYWTVAFDGARRIMKEEAIDGAMIVTEASSYWPTCPPVNTINNSGVTNDMHDNASDAITMWHTLEGGQGLTNPDPGNHQGAAWIKFTFDKSYTLDNMWIYNHNQFNMSRRGLRDVYVEYSPDGESWILLGEYRLNEAAGTDFFPYNNEIFFGGIKAKSVLITAKEDGGNFGEPYYGLSEVRFGLYQDYYF